ncbi:hypothetical protein IIC38_05150 [candidate division KSB1 bacterium]|nr:hypothetical protein [candidate division KSB1 bacterium]
MWATHIFKQIKDPVRRLISIYIIHPKIELLNKDELSEEEIALLEKYKRQEELLLKGREKFRKKMLEREKNKKKE